VVTDTEKQAKLDQVKEMFVLSEDSTFDPPARIATGGSEIMSSER
jgi:hypothetical protein